MEEYLTRRINELCQRLKRLRIRIRDYLLSE